MGATCLTVCPECSRHLRCGERACPFCGARVTSFLRVLEFRLKTRLNRGQGFSLGAALAAAGIVTSASDLSCIAAYGSPCMPTDTCEYGGVGNGGSGGEGSAGRAGATGAAGQLGSNPTAGSGGATAGTGGAIGETTGGEGGAGGAASDENGGRRLP
jgi:hypothetical protein